MMARLLHLGVLVLELCLATSSRLVMGVTSRLDAARHGLWLGASKASRNAAVYQWAEHNEYQRFEHVLEQKDGLPQVNRTSSGKHKVFEHCQPAARSSAQCAAGFEFFEPRCGYYERKSGTHTST
ncbi:hypothetical protein B0H14DRAFT_2595417 [Mycena olivaceomarginata]|nr:hypothetical protein B0H14DRAFT_2595417 [Mycena olivaceomarginata]